MRKQPWPEIRFGWEFGERYAAGKRPSVPANVPLKHLIIKCWDQDPRERPAFSQIYEELENIKKTVGPRGATKSSRYLFSSLEKKFNFFFIFSMEKIFLRVVDTCLLLQRRRLLQ
jgi:hypothetical protein